MPSGAVDVERTEIRFELAVGPNRPLSFVAKYGVMIQISGALGRMLAELRGILHSKGGAEASSAESVVEAHIQKERWSDVVLLHLINEQGITYAFALPSQTASDIADRLKNESAKPTLTGTA